MEDPKNIVKLEDFSCSEDLKLEQCVSTNWRIAQDNKRLCDTVSIVHGSKAPQRFTLEDVVSDSCLILQPENVNVENQKEACMIDINLITGQKMSRIGIVSEGSVLEFFKESGEYAGTIFAESIEEYEDATVYFAEFSFEKPTTQASIKFTRIHNSRSNMYLYGIKLVLEDVESLPNDRPKFEDIFKNSSGNSKQIPMRLPDFTNMLDYDENLSREMQACFRSFVGKSWGPRPEKTTEHTIVAETVEENKKNSVDTTEIPKKSNIELYIDEKLQDMEKRLMQRIADAEKTTNDKLDDIMKYLGIYQGT